MPEDRPSWRPLAVACPVRTARWTADQGRQAGHRRTPASAVGASASPSAPRFALDEEQQRRQPVLSRRLTLAQVDAPTQPHRVAAHGLRFRNRL